MKLHCKKSSDLIFIDKAAGFSTETLVEIYSQELGLKLFPFFSLDLPVTGSFALASSEKKALELQNLKAQNLIQSKHWFITAAVSDSEEMPAIDGAHFQRIKRSPFFELWQCASHQLTDQEICRLAAKLKLPVLGDHKNGGVPFPQLCLHQIELNLPQEVSWTTPAPRHFERLGLLTDQELVQWLTEVDRRQRVYNFLAHKDESLRLVHLHQLRVDLFGSQLWLYWYEERDPGPQDLERVEAFSRALGRPYLLKKMQNRGARPGDKIHWLHEDWKSLWTAEEANLKFQISSDRGQSPGLFLDQRSNRAQLQQKAKLKNILNLFAYTCGFSLSAALGEASQVTSVDVSKVFLDWGQVNFNLNQLDATRYEFFSQDSILFLKGCLKRNRKFDLIICDPPSFGRHKDQVFKLDRDLKELLTLAWDCLNSDGQILFSCNYEKWDLKEMKNRIQKILTSARLQPTLATYDYELPEKEALLKSVWILKGKS